MNTRPLAVGALSLVAAGAIGGGFALAMSGQGDMPQPTELRQVVQTATTTPTTVTTTPVATSTTTARPKVTTTTSRPAVAPKVQQVAPDPSPTSSTPQPVSTTPASTPTSTTSVRTPPPNRTIPGATVPTYTCGGGGCPSTSK